MLSKIVSIYSLLLAIAILLLGSGLLGTALGVHAGMLGFSGITIGVIMSAFFIGYIIGSYFCPDLISQVGHIRAFSVFAAFGTVSVIAHGLIVDPVPWWFLRIITGISMVGLYLVIESWLNTLSTHDNRGKVFSFYIMVTLLSLGIGQYLILVYGAGTLATYALCAIFFVLALIPISVTRLTPPTPVATPKLIIRRLLKISPLGMAGSAATGLSNGAFWGLGALYAHDLGFEEAGIALFMSAVILGGASLQIPIGHQSDNHDRRKVLMLVCFLASATALGGYLFAPNSQTGLLVSAVLFGGFSFAIYSLAVAHTNDYIDPTEVMDATRGLLLLNGIGAAVGPIVAGVLMQVFGSTTLMLYFALIFILLGVFALFRIVVTKGLPSEEQGDFVPISRTGTAAVEMDPRAEPLDENTNHSPTEP